MALYAKLGLMFVKVVTKPFANHLKERAATSERSRAVIVTVARSVTRASTYLTIRNAGHTPKFIKDTLNENQAIKRGSEIIAELFVFTVAGGATAAYIQSKEADSDRKKAQQRRELEARFKAVALDIAALRAQMDRIEAATSGSDRSGLGAAAEGKGAGGRAVRVGTLDGGGTVEHSGAASGFGWASAWWRRIAGDAQGPADGGDDSAAYWANRAVADVDRGRKT
jgi:hypothetical protein